jgi:hypothetical protein
MLFLSIMENVANVANVVVVVEVEVVVVTVSPAEEKGFFPLAPVQWVSRVLSPGVQRGRGVTLITHPI